VSGTAELVPCPCCDGTGKEVSYAGWNHPEEVWFICHLCGGSGKVPAEVEEEFLRRWREGVEVDGEEEIIDDIEF